MRRFTVLLLALAVGCSGSSGPQPDKGGKGPLESKPSAVEIKPNHDYTGWPTITPNGAGFEVRFPEEPTLKSSTPDRFGTSHLIAIRRLDLDHLGFVCTWRLLDRLIEDRVSIDSFLRGAQAAELRPPMARLIEERAISLNGAPGREYTVEVSPGNIKMCRVYLAGKLTVNLQVAGKDLDALRSKNVVKFLDSLKIQK